MRKNVLKYLYLGTFSILCLVSCKEDGNTLKYQNFKGQSMGTYYSIKFGINDSQDITKPEIDSILNDFEDELSTYRPNSTISKFNASSTGAFSDTTSQFYQAFHAARNLYEATNGYFDPTISPLVNYYGFGYDQQKHRSEIDPDTLKSLLELVGLPKIRVKTQKGKAFLFKSDPRQKLDLNASAKGRGVDLVGEYLYNKGIENFMVEIGGEIYAKGVNEQGEIWTLGISRPSPDAAPNDILIPVTITNQGMASSGNYRNFYKNDTLTFAHIINAKNGLSQPTDILSSTVIAPDCETADAFATALMAMGLEKSLALIAQSKHIKTCLIYYDATGDTLAYKYSNGFEQNIKK
jgi:thiamine biosynthesis lipoprotein